MMLKMNRSKACLLLDQSDASLSIGRAVCQTTRAPFNGLNLSVCMLGARPLLPAKKL